MTGECALQECAEDHCRRSAAGDAERQQRDHVPPDGCRRRHLRRDDPFRDAGAELRASLTVLAFDAVGHERRNRRAGTRNDAADHADDRGAQKCHPDLPGLGERRNARLDFRVPGERRRGESLLEAHENFAQAVRAHHHRQVSDAVAQHADAERETVYAVDLVDADGRDQHADEEADECVGERSAAQGDDAREAEQDDREILG